MDVSSQILRSIAYHLAVSTDLRSWRIIDQPIIQAGTQGNINEVGRFWLNPTNGSLLVASTNATPNPGSIQNFSSAGLPVRLWTSTDGGHTWTEITYRASARRPLRCSRQRRDNPGISASPIGSSGRLSSP